MHPQELQFIALALKGLEFLLVVGLVVNAIRQQFSIANNRQAIEMLTRSAFEVIEKKSIERDKELHDIKQKFEILQQQFIEVLKNAINGGNGINKQNGKEEQY